MRIFQLAYLFLIGHLFVWAPFALLDRFFCHGKMFQDALSLLLVEMVAITFVAAKIKQSSSANKE